MGAVAAAATWPFAGLYGLATRARNRRFDRGRSVTRVPVPVVSVGNLSVGGTGKTPLAGWLMAHFAARGHRPGLLLRGYGEDEVELHRRWSAGGVVVADADRVVGAGRAIEEGADVLVLDDGFQHRRLARDLDLVLLSAEQHGAVRTGRLLPRGPLRERGQGLRRAHAIIVTHRVTDPTATKAWAGETAPGVPVFAARLRPSGWMTLEGEPTPAPEAPVVALSSVADPRTFWAMLAELGVEVEDTRAYGDHYQYGPRDLEHLGAWSAGRPIATTEKDAVKLAGLGNVYVLGLEVDFGEDLPRVVAMLDGLGR